MKSRLSSHKVLRCWRKPCSPMLPPVITESQNGQGWKGPLWVTRSNPPAKAGSPRAGCTAPRPGGAGISPEKETPQPPWAAWASAPSLSPRCLGVASVLGVNQSSPIPAAPKLLEGAVQKSGDKQSASATPAKPSQKVSTLSLTDVCWEPIFLLTLAKDQQRPVSNDLAQQ